MLSSPGCPRWCSAAGRHLEVFRVPVLSGAAVPEASVFPPCCIDSSVHLAYFLQQVGDQFYIITSGEATVLRAGGGDLSPFQD